VRTNDASVRYITWDSLEPDSWASIWLIKRHIDPDAEIVLRPVGAPAENGITFGMPDAQYRRSQGDSVYESLRRGFRKDEPALRELGRIIHDIEISPWGNRTSGHSVVVERSFRHLQDTFEARNVPVDCYGRFFDEVYALLSSGGTDSDWLRLDELANTATACRADSSTLARRDLSPFVRRLQSGVVLDHIAADKKIVFIDVREPAEYGEFHIPGAVNIPLRDLEPGMKARFEGADLVIPYCIKDFRGFEMARSLAELGVRNVGIMQPYGIAGWRHLGLPVTSRGGLSESEALEKLAQCAHAGSCLETQS
jgi:rhodanese-related sulfurtransferase